jgi:hypothetical protein
MNAISNNASSLINATNTLVKRNTTIEVIDAKQSGNAVDIEKIQQSNQEIKGKSKSVGIAAYQVSLTKSAIDTYAQSTENRNTSSTSSSENNNDIYTFDAQEVNDVRATVQKRAIGIAAYERVQSA